MRSIQLSLSLSLSLFENANFLRAFSLLPVEEEEEEEANLRFLALSFDSANCQICCFATATQSCLLFSSLLSVNLQSCLFSKLFGVL